MRKFWAILILPFILLSGLSNAQSVRSINISQQININTSKSTQRDKPDIKNANYSFYDQKTASDTIIASDTRKKRGHAQIVQSDSDIAQIKINTDSIASNTHRDWRHDGWNHYGYATFYLSVFAFIVSCIALFYSKKTFLSQEKTEKHTSNIPKEVQIGILDDLPRHFYRNLVCTLALYRLYKSKENNPTGVKPIKYPSESNVRKLQTIPDDIFVRTDIPNNNTKENPYSNIHRIKLQFRNYNIEVEVAANHLSRKEISEESLEQDFDNLFFKPFFLVKSIYDFEKALAPSSTNFLVSQTIMTILSTHFENLAKPSNFKLLFESEAKKFLNFSDNADYIKSKSAKGSIERSIDEILNYGKVEKGKNKSNKKQNNEINYNYIPNTKNLIEAEIPREYVKSCLKNDRARVFLEGNNNVPGILSITDEEGFKNFCICFEFIDNKKDEILKANELYGFLSQYINYLRIDTWEFRTLFNFILTIDAAIETDRIGMVEYS